MTDLLNFEGLPGPQLPEGAAPDTVIRLDFTTRQEETRVSTDSLSIRIDVSPDSQALVTERFITQSGAGRLLTERLSEFNERESGAIRMVLLRLDQDSVTAFDRLLLSDTLAGGAFLGKTEFRIGYENYRGFVFQRMLPEIFLGCRSGPSPAHRLVHRGRSGAAGRSVANLRSGRARRNAAGRGRFYDRQIPARLAPGFADHLPDRQIPGATMASLTPATWMSTSANCAAIWPPIPR